LKSGNVQAPLDPDSSPSESTGSPPEERTVALFQRIEKALRFRRLYASGSRLSQASLDELAAEMTRYLEEFEYLDLTITPDAFLTGETAHLKGPRTEASIAFRLYRDGIRSLRLRAGLTGDEIDRLLAALDHPMEGDQKLDDDLATILWKEDFRNIEFIAVDEIASPQVGGKDGSAGGEVDLAKVLSGRIDDMVEAIKTPLGTSSREVGKAVSAAKLEIFEMERQGKASTILAAEEDIVEVNPAMIDRLRLEAGAADATAMRRRVIGIIADMFSSDECTLPAAEIQSTLARLTWELLAQGDVAGVAEALDGLAEERGPFRSRPTGQAIYEGILGTLASTESLGLLQAAARSGAGSDPRPFERILSRMPPFALASCIRQMSALEAGPVQEAYRRVLKVRSQEDRSAFTAYLEEGGDEREEFLREAVEKKKIQGMDGVLKDLFSGEDEKLKSFIIRSSGGLDDQARKSFIERGLSDPSLKVRLGAYRAAESAKDRSLIAGLKKRFEQCTEDDERIRAIHGIAVLGGEEALSFLEEVLLPAESWWRFGQGKDRKAPWRRAAIISLRDVHDPTVREFVAQGAKLKDRELAEAFAIARSPGGSFRGRDR
jgi:hypothetical protein